MTTGTVTTGAMGDRITRRLDDLALITDEPGQITRPYLGPAHGRAVTLVSQWMREAGMESRLDAAGSVVGTYAAHSEQAGAEARTLILGSHIDSVPNAGKLDGCLGVVTAIEVVAALHARGRRLPFAIDVVAFGDEEGNRFASTLGGSRALAGVFDHKILDEADASGITRREALQAFGCRPETIDGLARDPARTLGYVEVHIEQGPVLEAEGLPVGIVTAINGASRGAVEVRGEGGHAGTVPMGLRRDALAAAAEMVLAIEARAKAEPDLVATVGRIEVVSQAVNSVPGLVRFSLDIRSPSDDARQSAVAALRDGLGAIAARRGVTIDMAIGYDAAAAPCDQHLSDLMAAAVTDLAIAPRLLPSGAGHDAMSFRGRIPIAMLFVRCRGGVSHSPAEHAEAADVDAAARVLSGFLERLAAAS